MRKSLWTRCYTGRRFNDLHWDGKQNEDLLIRRSGIEPAALNRRGRSVLFCLTPMSPRGAFRCRLIFLMHGEGAHRGEGRFHLWTTFHVLSSPQTLTEVTLRSGAAGKFRCQGHLRHLLITSH